LRQNVSLLTQISDIFLQVRDNSGGIAGHYLYRGRHLVEERNAPVTRLLKSACIVRIVIAGCLSAIAQNSNFNDRRNALIADQFNNRVIEVHRKGNIV